MGVQITIRDIVESVSDLESLASKPSLESWLEDVQRRKAISGARISRDVILVNGISLVT